MKKTVIERKGVKKKGVEDVARRAMRRKKRMCDGRRNERYVRQRWRKKKGGGTRT